MARIVSGSVSIPGMDDLDWRYFRDIEDHLIRMTDALDSQRDLLAGLTDVYLSTISNRLNVVMKQLSVVAGVFLPLTFLTGFFGQNFPWMVEHIGGAAAFWILGIGLQVTAVAGLLVWFRRRGWV
jgi:magnesium transporter